MSKPEPDRADSLWLASFLLELLEAWAPIWPDIRFEDRTKQPAHSIMDITTARFLDENGEHEVRLLFAGPGPNADAGLVRLEAWRHQSDRWRGSSGISVLIAKRATVDEVIAQAIRLLASRLDPLTRPIPFEARLRNVVAADHEVERLSNPLAHVGPSSFLAIAPGASGPDPRPIDPQAALADARRRRALFMII